MEAPKPEHDIEETAALIEAKKADLKRSVIALEDRITEKKKALEVKFEHAKERVEQTTDILRRFRWVAVAVAVAVGVKLGLRRKPRALLPAVAATTYVEPRRPSFLGSLFRTAVGIALKELIDRKLHNPDDPSKK